MFGPANSLILLFDHLSHDLSEEMERQLDEIGKYYRFVPFSELARGSKRTRKMGVASVVFQNARKSFFLRAQKSLFDRDIVPLVCVRPDIQGTNRLPLVDEYRGETAETFARLTWEDPLGAAAELKAQREKLGPPPLNEMDPTFFLGTWGNLLELPPERYEVGIHVPHRLTDLSAFLPEVNFIKKQLGKAPEGAFLPSAEAPTVAILREAGVPASLSLRVGVVDKQTPAHDIPRFLPEPNDA